MSKDLVTKDFWAKEADAVAETETLPAAQTISTRGGVLALGEDPLPGNMMAVIVLDFIRENTLYEERYDDENPTPPICYAFGRDEKTMAPDLDAMDLTDPKAEWFDPPAHTCAECPMNEWGSSDRGRGKACQNRRRLMVIPAGEFVPRGGRSRDFDLELFDDEEHFQKVDACTLKLPVTSVKGWSKYVQSLSSAVRRPPYGVVTVVSVVPDPKAQYRLTFEMEEEVPDHLVEVIRQRHKDAQKAIIQHYRPPEEEEEEKPRRGNPGLKGLKKKKKAAR